MGRPVDMEQKGCESSIHDHDIDKCDHGGVADVLDGEGVTSDIGMPSRYLVEIYFTIDSSRVQIFQYVSLWPWVLWFLSLDGMQCQDDYCYLACSRLKVPWIADQFIITVELTMTKHWCIAG